MIHQDFRVHTEHPVEKFLVVVVSGTADGAPGHMEYTASSKRITAAILELYDRIVDEKLLIRRMYLTIRALPQV